jgi:Malonyl-CoA decarboxylase C-terminal domain
MHRVAIVIQRHRLSRGRIFYLALASSSNWALGGNNGGCGGVIGSLAAEHSSCARRPPPRPCGGASSNSPADVSLRNSKSYFSNTSTKNTVGSSPDDPTLPFSSDTSLQSVDQGIPALVRAAQTTEDKHRVRLKILSYYRQKSWSSSDTSLHEFSNSSSTRYTWVELLASQHASEYNNELSELSLDSLLYLRLDILNYPRQSTPLPPAQPTANHIEAWHQAIRVRLQVLMPRSPDLHFRRLASFDDLPPELLARSSVFQQSKDIVAKLYERPHRHVFCLVYRSIPAAVLYVALLPTIPTSLNDVWGATSAISDSTSAGHSRTTTNTGAEAAPMTVATFYSIVANIEPALSGIGLGEHLIHQAVHYLQHNQPCIPFTFVTLSPMPTFRSWLEASVDELDECSDEWPCWLLVHEDSSLNAIEALEQAWWKGKERLAGTSTQRRRALILRTWLSALQHSRGAALDDKSLDPVRGAMETLLRQAAQYYLFRAKTANRLRLDATAGGAVTDPTLPLPPLVPLDSVARFHASNGASLYRTNLHADASETGWQSSFGVMVNYLYDLNQLSMRQAAYQQSGNVVPWHHGIEKTSSRTVDYT